MGIRTKIITEYRQTGGDADGDNIVGLWELVGRWTVLMEIGAKYFTVSSSTAELSMRPFIHCGIELYRVARKTGTLFCTPQLRAP